MISIVFAMALGAAPGCGVQASTQRAPFRYELLRCAADAGAQPVSTVRLCLDGACLVDPCGHHPTLPEGATDLDKYGDLEDLRDDPSGADDRWLLTFRAGGGGDESFAWLTRAGDRLACREVPGFAQVRARAEKLLVSGERRGACGANITLVDVNLNLLVPVDAGDDEPCAGSHGALSIDARFTRTGLEFVRARRLTRAQVEATQ
jgi:hypothetical protein